MSQSQPHTPAKPIQLVLPHDPAPGTAAPVPLWPVVVLVPLCIAAAILLRKQARRESPADAAFRKLARRVGLSGSDRRALSEIAGDAHPVALLLSPWALRRALEAAGSDEAAARAARKLSA